MTANVSDHGGFRRWFGRYEWSNLYTSTSHRGLLIGRYTTTETPATITEKQPT